MTCQGPAGQTCQDRPARTGNASPRPARGQAMHRPSVDLPGPDPGACQDRQCIAQTCQTCQGPARTGNGPARTCQEACQDRQWAGQDRQWACQDRQCIADGLPGGQPGQAMGRPGQAMHRPSVGYGLTATRSDFPNPRERSRWDSIADLKVRRAFAVRPRRSAW
jgi:hypothetical protein